MLYRRTYSKRGRYINFKCLSIPGGKEVTEDIYEVETLSGCEGLTKKQKKPLDWYQKSGNVILFSVVFAKYKPLQIVNPFAYQAAF